MPFIFKEVLSVHCPVGLYFTTPQNLNPPGKCALQVNIVLHGEVWYGTLDSALIWHESSCITPSLRQHLVSGLLNNK